MLRVLLGVMFAPESVEELPQSPIEKIAPSDTGRGRSSIELLSDG